MRLTIDRPEPGRRLAAGRLRRQALEAPEQARHIVRRQARALVGDADDGLAVLCGDAHLDAAAERAVFDGIAEEVVDRLAHAVGIADRDAASAGAATVIDLILARGERLVGLNDVVDQRDDVDRLAAGW